MPQLVPQCLYRPAFDKTKQGNDTDSVRNRKPLKLSFITHSTQWASRGMVSSTTVATHSLTVDGYVKARDQDCDAAVQEEWLGGHCSQANLNLNVVTLQH